MFGWLTLIWSLLKALWSLAKWLYKKTGELIQWMSRYTYGWVYDRIKRFVAEHLPASQGLNNRFRAFNGFYPFLLFVAATLFSVIFLVYSIPTWNQENSIFLELLFNTTVGSFSGLLIGGLEFAPGTLVAIAFSGHLLSLCMDTHNHTELNQLGKPVTVKPSRWIRAICYLIYLAMTTILAMLLADVFQSIGEWGYTTAEELFNKQTDTFWDTAGKVLALIPLVYTAVLLGLITIREYAESIFFGVVGMFVISIIVSTLEAYVDITAVWAKPLLSVLAVLMILGVDAYRNYAVEKFEQSCQ